MYTSELVYQMAAEDISYFLKKAGQSVGREKVKLLCMADATLAGLLDWQEYHDIATEGKQP